MSRDNAQGSQLGLMLQGQAHRAVESGLRMRREVDFQ
jgi:hypothetical protein